MAEPEIFGLRDEDGHAYLLVTDFDDATIEGARRAASTCPEQAIVIEP
jgi:ferredoxin